jgi:DNA (cytosine-5)-methyltransferase 1
MTCEKSTAAWRSSYGQAPDALRIPLLDDTYSRHQGEQVPLDDRHTFIDLFSGAGGMTYGFHTHPSFKVVAAFDGEFGKPSSGGGSLGCNQTFQSNMDLEPITVDLSTVDDDFIEGVRRDILGGHDLDVLSACPPCTGFSRANPNNHLEDDTRNSLVVRTEAWVRGLRPRVLVMENARELIKGNFSHHYRGLRRRLEAMGYDVHGSVHMLNDFGLPQRRERALIVATTLPEGAKGLEDLWRGYRVDPAAATVRRAIEHLPPVGAGEKHEADPCHVSPRMNESTLARMQAVPADGGSWKDLRHHPQADSLMTPAMKRYIAAGKFGSHPDVYGRMAWDRPAITIKRECAHVGNGRYCHPEQHRLCTVRELALLQGFPADYQFGGTSLSNKYRHIGDAVPPLISYQLAHIVRWLFTGNRPNLTECVLGGTSLKPDDIQQPGPGSVKTGTPQDESQQELFAGTAATPTTITRTASGLDTCAVGHPQTIGVNCSVPQVGTAYGKETTFETRSTSFTKTSLNPNQVISLIYGTEEQFKAWGVPLPCSTPSHPNPFPGEAQTPKYCPAPEGWEK